MLAQQADEKDIQSRLIHPRGSRSKYPRNKGKIIKKEFRSGIITGKRAKIRVHDEGLGNKLDIADEKEAGFEERASLELEERDGGAFELNGLIMSRDGLKIRKGSLFRFGTTHILKAKVVRLLFVQVN